MAKLTRSLTLRVWAAVPAAAGFWLAIAAAACDGGAAANGGGGGGSRAGASSSGGATGSGAATTPNPGTGGTTIAGADAGAGNDAAPINSNNDAAPTTDGPPAITDAQPISEAGQMGVVAPGVGQDTPPPPRPTVGMYMGKAQRDITFTAGSLDPAAKQGHVGDAQHGRLDSSKTLKWKLIVLLPGINGGPGLGTSGWIASRGYHEFDVAYDSGIPGAPNKPDPRATDPATVGNTRMNQFDGKGRTPACSDDTCSASAPTIARADSIEERLTRGLRHLAMVDPMGGWDWYLNADGTVRWSDCGFFGYSYGATHAAVISVYVRLGLIVVGSGPWNESHPEATWIRTASATPGNRAFAIYGKMDGRYLDYEAETKTLGWPGPYPFEISASTHGLLPGPTPWYMGSHSILVDDQGHTEFCAQDFSQCLYAFDGAGQ